MKPSAAPEGGSTRFHEESFSEWFHAWRYLFVFLGLVAVTLLFYAEEDWRGQRAWRLYKEKVAARGESFELAALIPPHVPDEENFAATPALSPLFGFIPGTQRWTNANAPRLFDSLGASYDAASKLATPQKSPVINSWVRQRTDLRLWAAAFNAGTNRNQRTPLIPTNLSSRQAALDVLQALEDYRPVLEELRVASHRPRSRFNIRYEEDNPANIILPHLAKIKHFCLVLQLRASAELAARQTQDALDDIDLLLHLADSSRDEPILISQMVRMEEVRMALQPLAEGMAQWSAPQLKALQDRLQRIDFCADAARSLRGERTLLGIGIIEWTRRTPDKLRVLDTLGVSGSMSELWPVGLLMSAAPDGWSYFEERNQARAFDQYLLPLIDVTNHLIRPAAVRAADAAIGRLTEGSPIRRFFHHELWPGLLLPGISRVVQKTAFAQTAIDTAAVACALERYRLEHGQFPDSLDKLTPELMALLPHDLINGQPLKYRLQPDGHYLLYSVGWNEQDDAGVPERSSVGETFRGSIWDSSGPEQHNGDWVWTDNF